MVHSLPPDLVDKRDQDLNFMFPQICGKRKRVKLDGSQQIKVHLEKSAQINTETKLDTFMAVYKKLTGKDVVFEYVD
jgi:hypothetical protein